MRVHPLLLTILCLQVAEISEAQTNVTGVVLDKDGHPVAGVRCSISGLGLRVFRTGMREFVFTDKEGHFSIPLRASGPVIDLQFDEEGYPMANKPRRAASYAPTFLGGVTPADGPVRVVMREGKLLRGRLVQRLKGEAVPIAHAKVELRMPTADFAYHSEQETCVISS